MSPSQSLAALRAGPYPGVGAPRPARQRADRADRADPIPHAEMRIYALQFADGVDAADFIVALHGAVSRAGTPDTEHPMRAWIDAPLRARGSELCCVYITDACLEAAQAAGLHVPPTEPVDEPTFPEGRILVLDAAPVG